MSWGFVGFVVLLVVLDVVFWLLFAPQFNATWGPEARQTHKAMKALHNNTTGSNNTVVGIGSRAWPR